MKKLVIIIAVIIALIIGGLITMNVYLHPFDAGNSMKYSAKRITPEEDSMLKDKTIIFLGSSVTYGACSEGESFVEFLANKHGIIPVKEAVSGTTLVDNGKSSYIARMKTIDKNIKADAFVCQLSTNDATKELPIGEITDEKDIEKLDTSTVAGAIEYIIIYARQTWNCPVIFYTGTQYDSERYKLLVDLLPEIQKKYDIDVIDLWNNPMNDIPKEKYDLYMADGIHPTKAGYKEWWLPEFEKHLSDILK